MSLPRQGRFSQAVTVLWSNGSTFSGYILCILIPPTVGGSIYQTIAVKGFQPQQRVPLFTRVPIKLGKYHAEAGLWFNEDLTPPATEYVAYWYDDTNRLITASPSIHFTVTTDPFTPPTPTLLIPSVGSIVPTADIPVGEPGAPPPAPYTIRFVAVTGTVDGANVTFTLDAAVTGTPWVYLDGRKMISVLDYTLSGTVLTFVSAPTPDLPPTPDAAPVHIEVFDLGSLPPTYSVRPVAVTGTIDGANVTFTLASVTTGIPFVYLDGRKLINVLDYTISGTTLTFTSAPISNLPPTADTAAAHIEVFDL